MWMCECVLKVTFSAPRQEGEAGAALLASRTAAGIPTGSKKSLSL